jgi:hypothetical protein
VCLHNSSDPLRFPALFGRSYSSLAGALDVVATRALKATSEGSRALDRFVETHDLGDQPVEFCGEHAVRQALGKHVRK